ncbi:DUF892 family protein [Flavobacterium beibuense]|uniref:DUF892 domain containing protein n=1 Tax=Flavobacterium beibuense TaxID=657326 RepID=A0A444W890_9FLAO|nr:DUF892 family protein [Flavobacterium beibuense]RYJ42111.1 DUF892 domain containing protein [Flavobacterium beibuense]
MQLNVIKKDGDETRELRSLFEKQLSEVNWSEKRLLTVFPLIIKNCYSKDLIFILEKHVKNTLIRLGRLQLIYKAIGLPPVETEYKALTCLIDEVDELLKQTKKGVVRDAGIIAAIQKMEHYKIAAYGTMRAYALALREEDIIQLLEDCLKEEKNTDMQLTQIAESHINIEAADKEI